MSNQLIIGRNFNELKKGYPVTINQDDIRAFTVLKTAAAVVEPGEVLLLGGSTRVYIGAENDAALGTKVAKDVAGIAIATNVKTKEAYNSTDSETTFGLGQKGDMLQKGEVAVEFAPTASGITENDPVYLVVGIVGTPVTADLGKLINAISSTPADTILLPGYVWSGITEGTLSVVRRVY